MPVFTLDTLIIMAYLVGIIVLGCWAGMRQRSGNAGDSYFLAGRTLTWPIIGMALFSTNISTVHLVSLAQEGYTNGLVYGNFEWMAAVTLIVLALFFAPFYIRSRVATLPDFLERRYSRASRDWLAFISIISAIFVHIGFSLYAGAVVLEGMYGLDRMTSILVIAAITGLYTIVGGLMAVVVTESVQTVILLLGAICLTAIGYVKVGGWAGITAHVDPVKLTMFRPAGDPSGLPWYAILLGYPVIGIWYWCTDQTIVQRVLGARDENHARTGALFAGFIKLLPVFIFVLPGLICRALIHQGKLPATLNNSEQTYAFMIDKLLPVGLKGVVAAALLAALMSTVSGALNSAATLFVYDLYGRWKPAASQNHLVRVGRIVTFVGMLVAVAWSPLLGRYPTVFQGINAAISYIAPPITVVFTLGVFWRGASSTGSITTLVTGAALGFVIFLLDFFKANTGWSVPFLMSAVYLACFCAALHVTASLLRPDAPSPERDALVWTSPLEALRGKAWPHVGDYRFLSAVLLAVLIVLFVVFE